MSMHFEQTTFSECHIIKLNSRKRSTTEKLTFWSGQSSRQLYQVSLQISFYRRLWHQQISALSLLTVHLWSAQISISEIFFQYACAAADIATSDFMVSCSMAFCHVDSYLVPCRLNPSLTLFCIIKCWFNADYNCSINHSLATNYAL